MKESSSYGLQQLPNLFPFDEYRRRLCLEGVPLNVVLWGREIDIELTCGPFTFLHTNYDYFYGSHHWIYLLDPVGRPIDMLCMPDVFGFISDLKIVSPQEITFGYYGTNDKWSLTVWEHGYWSFTPNELARRLNRFLLSKRFLEVRRTKGEPWREAAAPNPLG